MSIPTMKKDLAIIQKLSDLPNSTEGLTADQLKAKFDEAVLELQSWINETLIPALTAENIPFTPSSVIGAGTVDGAIRAVQEQMTEVSSGAIANGSVTAEKLAEGLLERVYGGRPWVSLDTPDSGDTVETGFPLGQLWLRPAFTVHNNAGSQWTCSGMTANVQDDRVTFTGNNTVAVATATQSVSGLGQDGDRVYVLFAAENADRELTGLTVALNGAEAQDTAAGVWEGSLSGGALTVKLTATWPSTSLAGGSFDIVNYAVVNVDAILRQAAGAKDMQDWAGYLNGLLPLSVYSSPAEVLVQTGSGVWWPMGYDTLPVSRGGTGESSLTPGAMLYGGGERLEQLAPPTESGSFLQFVDGLPKWQTVEETASGGSLLRVMTGSYTGTGESRTVSLPLKPVLLNIGSSSTDSSDRSTTLGQGCSDSASYAVEGPSGGTTYRGSSVKLSGKALTFTGPYPCNRSGVKYNWVAIY